MGCQKCGAYTRCDCAWAELTAALEELVDVQNGPPMGRDREWYLAMTKAARLLGRKQAELNYSRCRESPGSDGDTYVGCVLNAGHAGECQRQARPDVARERAAKAAGGE
jgi:hypothetical protein